MNHFQQRLLLINGRNFQKSRLIDRKRAKDLKLDQACGRWLKHYFLIDVDLSRVTNHEMNVKGMARPYWLAYQQIIGQIALLQDVPVECFFDKWLTHSLVCYDDHDFRSAYEWLYRTTHYISQIIKLSPVRMETRLTIDLLGKRIPGHLYQLDTSDSWNVSGMSITLGYLTGFSGQPPLKKAKSLAQFLLFRGSHNQEFKSVQSDNRFLNKLLSKFLSDESANLNPFHDGLTPIRDPLNEPKIRQFIHGCIADPEVSRTISDIVIGSVRSFDLPKPYTDFKGLLFLSHVFSPKALERYCYKNTADKDDDDTTRINGYFHTVLLMIDLLAHHFKVDDENVPLVSDAYYHFMDYLYRHRFGPYQDQH